MSDAFNRYKKRITENLSNAELQELQSAYEQRYKTLYKNREIGKIPEKTFQELEGGAPKTFKLPNGDIRKVDNLIDNVAKEIKSGKLERNSFIEKQLEKDLELLTNKQFPVNKIEWHCFGGASEEMKNAMNILEEKFGKEKFEFIDYTKH